MQHVESVSQLPNGTVQHEHIQNELQDDAKRETVLHHLADAKPKQQGHTGRTEHFHDRKKDAERPNGSNVGVTVGPIDGSKSLGFFFLAVERLHNRHPRHVFLNEFIDFGHLVPYIHKSALDVLLENPGRPKQNGDGEQDHQRQGPVNPQHGAYNDKQGEQITNGVEQPIAEHIRNSINVADVTRDQGSDWGLVKKLETKIGHVPEQLPSKV